MTMYRVEYLRTTSVTCYLDVEASNADEARTLAAKMTEDNDDILKESPETYTSECTPTGEVVNLDESESE